jgi:hypothetical protein
MWGKWKRRQVPTPADIDEARKLREQQSDQLETVRRRQPYVDTLTSRLIERREINHFGDSIQVTFRRRNA